MDKRFFNEKKKFGGGINIMVWGMISNEGPETINWINEHGEKLNSSGYIELLYKTERKDFLVRWSNMPHCKKVFKLFKRRRC